MTAGEWEVHAGSDVTRAAWEPPTAGDTGVVFVCGHGAGGNMDDRSILAVTAALRAHGIGTVRFNFFYRQRKSARPDPMPRLLACFEAVVSRVREELHPRVLVLGGRSMGGRAASMLVAGGAPCDRLLLLAYPLHPPGHPEKLRAAHLSSIDVPVLCINGTRDDFCERPLMEEVLRGVGANWQMHWIDGADHSFHVLKRSGRTDGDVLEEVAKEVERWVGGL